MLAVMPELPEVETVVRYLQKRLVGRCVRKVRLKRRDIVATGASRLQHRLESSTVTRLRRRGKLIIIDLDGGQTLAIHLRMTGQVVVRDTLPASRHVHFSAMLDDGAILVYQDARRFGRLYFGDTPLLDQFSPSGAMGPEPFEIPAARFCSDLRRRKRMLKPLLLDQSFMAGLGNIYVDESLFAARLHPCRLSNSVSVPKAIELLKQIKLILRAAIRHNGTTISDYVQADGNSGGFGSKLKVYGRTGKPCPRCGRAIRKITVAQRGTHICPRCQRPMTL
jgi:formamidopyrimidine-DNA glycosylase